jgi:nucleoside-diphosphate-sugar epimerase
LAENSKETSETYNIAAEPIPMRDIVSLIARGLGKTPPRIVIPTFPIVQALRLGNVTPFKNTAERIQGTLQSWLAEDVYSSERLANRYKLSTSVSIAEAIDREVEYYLSYR